MKRLLLGNSSWNFYCLWAPTQPRWCDSWVLSRIDKLIFWLGGSGESQWVVDLFCWKKLCKPRVLGQNWLTALHHAMNLSPKKISELVSPCVWLPGHCENLQSITDHCLTCARVNEMNDILPPGQQSQFWEMTSLKSSQECMAANIWWYFCWYHHRLHRGLSIPNENGPHGR